MYIYYIYICIYTSQQKASEGAQTRSLINTPHASDVQFLKATLAVAEPLPETSHMDPRTCLCKWSQQMLTPDVCRDGREFCTFPNMTLQQMNAVTARGNASHS